MSHGRSPADPALEAPTRRGFLARVSGGAMVAGLIAGYGTLAAMAVRFLYPARPRDTAWTFVTEVARMLPGESRNFQSPLGERIAITRQGDLGRVEDFIALSSTCPHLGCQVHWEAQNDRFFCPCHNGTFDPLGRGTGGPPGEAGQSLPRYPLKVEGGLLFIEVPIEPLVRTGSATPAEPRAMTARAGHDPCLEPRPKRASA